MSKLTNQFRRLGVIASSTVLLACALTACGGGGGSDSTGSGGSSSGGGTSGGQNRNPFETTKSFLNFHINASVIKLSIGVSIT